MLRRGEKKKERKKERKTAQDPIAASGLDVSLIIDISFQACGGGQRSIP